MRVFQFDPSEYAASYARDGYVKIQAGVSPAFLAFVLKEAHDLVEEQKSLKDWEFKGKKQQFLFSFPRESDYPDGVHEHVAAVTGLLLHDLTLCERHIKVYDETAVANPPPHKDRVASEVAVGIPIVVPEGSELILYPSTDVSPNPYNTTALHRSSLDEHEFPENKLKGISPVSVDVQPGDVIMFRGSAIWHERVNSANTATLYLKFNGMRLDPLGEDRSTMAQRQQSLELLSSLTDAQLLASAIEVSPRLERISRHYTRLYWKEVIQAYVGGEQEITLTERDLQIFRNVEGGRTVAGTLRRIGVSDSELPDALSATRRLIARGGIDIRV